MRSRLQRHVAGVTAALALVVAAALPVRAQRLHLTHYGAADGLPSSRVLSLAQDRAGYLWFGTDAGLARYDGTRFEIVPLVPVVPGARIVALQAVDDSVVYGTADGGVGVVGPEGVRPLVGEGLAAPVRSIRPDPEGGLLLATSGGVVRYLGGETRRLGVADGVPAGCCRSVHRDAAGRVWAGGDAGLYQVRGDEYVPVDLGLVQPAAINVLLEDQRGDLWVGGAAGLHRQRGARFAQVPTGIDEPVLAGVSAGDELWFGTAAGAVRVVAGRVETIGSDAGLGTGAVQALLADREGSVWFGGEAGAAKWTRARFVAYDSRHGLPDDFVVGLHGTADRLLVGTRTGVASRDANGPWRVEIDLASAPGTFVTAVSHSERTGLLVGTNRGLIVPPRRTTNPVGGVEITALLARADGSVFVGTRQGLRRLGDGSLQPVLARGPAAEQAVVDLAEDDGGRLWLVLEGGRVWREVMGGLEPVPLEQDGRAVTVTDLTAIEDGVWAATDGAGAWLLRSGANPSRLTRGTNGLASDFVRAVLPADDGAVWLCTARGLDLWRGDSGISHFDLADGLAALSCNPGAAARGPDGRLWLGTASGLSHDAGETRRPPHPPTVVVSGVQVGGDRMRLEGVLQLPPEHGDIRIEYSALTFLDETSTLFQYRLLGQSEAWSRPTRDRQVAFVGLGPGEYVFQVQAIAESQLWSVAPAEARFVIRPYFWQTVWFRLAAVLLLSTALFASFWRRLGKVDDERQQLRLMVDKRTRELVEKNALLERMATTDELTGLANRRFFLDTMERELRKLTRVAGEQQLALLVIDLDRFKAVNDRYGHTTGDAVLRHVARRLAEGVRATDLPARYGGEEFAILLPDTDIEGARFLAEKLRQDVEDSPARHDGATIRVTISVGVAAIDSPSRYDSRIEADLVRRADEAMYEAKSGGRNRVVVARAAQLSV